MFKLNKEYQYKLKSMPRGRNFNTPITSTCKIPYTTVTVDYNSNCFICSCDGWLPIPVGKVQDFASLDEVWNSPTAQLLQDDIDKKRFTWCAVDHCGIKNRNLTSNKSTLIVNIDESCNLSCPSCRRDSIMHSSGPVYDTKLHAIKHILTWLDKFDRPLTITLSGNGDPFASNVIRPLIQSYQPKLMHAFHFKTNGLLLKKQLSTSPLLPNVDAIEISVDAGSKQVYEDVRRPGKWEVLLENFEYLKEVRLSRKTILYFCLQNKNYKDVPAFVNLCKMYGFNGIVHQLDDWGTWNSSQVKTPDAWTIANGIYADHNVLDPAHPNHNDMLAVLKGCNKSNVMFSSIIRTVLL